MNWFRFWADTFMLFSTDKARQAFQPYARPVCYMILPCHEDWWWQYEAANKPANDNSIV